MRYPKTASGSIVPKSMSCLNGLSGTIKVFKDFKQHHAEQKNLLVHFYSLVFRIALWSTIQTQTLLYLYSAFNNTNCNKALHSIKIGKLCQ